jgi:Xaa-Pro aminopeptidase
LSGVPDVLIHGDTVRVPELRHEVPLMLPDPFLYLERGGRRALVISSLEVPRVEAAALDLEVRTPEAFGLDELLAQGTGRSEAELEIAVRACLEYGVTEALVPAGFPLELADLLRARGVDVRPDRELFAGRRRVKNEHELAGVRRAQAAATAGIASVAESLRRAEVASDGGLVLDGEPLTSERLRAGAEAVIAARGGAADDLIVSHGAQTAIGHELGSGQLREGEPIVLDFFPRDRESACFGDMTRTFVVGEAPEELRRFHALCREALDRALAAVRPGVTGKELHRLVCELFHEHGYPTQLSKEPGETLEDGFFHSLGHGVGLEVHEEPGLGRGGTELVAGDVIAVEPGLYRSGFGGCRLEDTVLVTGNGCENLTDYPYDLEP